MSPNSGVLPFEAQRPAGASYGCDFWLSRLLNPNPKSNRRQTLRRMRNLPTK